MHSDEYDTAEMLTRLQRQVSNLRGGDSDDSIALIVSARDRTRIEDGTTADIFEDDGFVWSTDAWGYTKW